MVDRRPPPRISAAQFSIDPLALTRGYKRHSAVFARRCARGMMFAEGFLELERQRSILRRPVPWHASAGTLFSPLSPRNENMSTQSEILMINSSPHDRGFTFMAKAREYGTADYGSRSGNGDEFGVRPAKMIDASRREEPPHQPRLVKNFAPSKTPAAVRTSRFRRARHSRIWSGRPWKRPCRSIAATGRTPPRRSASRFARYSENSKRGVSLQ